MISIIITPHHWPSLLTNRQCSICETFIDSETTDNTIISLQMLTGDPSSFPVKKWFIYAPENFRGQSGSRSRNRDQLWDAASSSSLHQHCQVSGDCLSHSRINSCYNSNRIKFIQHVARVVTCLSTKHSAKDKNTTRRFSISKDRPPINLGQQANYCTINNKNCLDLTLKSIFCFNHLFSLPYIDLCRCSVVATFAILIVKISCMVLSLVCQINSWPFISIVSGHHNCKIRNC